MVAVRRVGAETSATRALIINATESLIREEGYASVSTRRVAARAGLKPSLVHYYFPTTDDLLLSLSRKGAEESDQMIAKALEAEDPIRLWQAAACDGEMRSWIVPSVWGQMRSLPPL